MGAAYGSNGDSDNSSDSYLCLVPEALFPGDLLCRGCRQIAVSRFEDFIRLGEELQKGVIWCRGRYW